MDIPARFSELAHQAALAANYAHVPNSGYRVGAAILMNGGYVYTGCNAEIGCSLNTIHAEINAIGNLVSNGGSSAYAEAIAIYTDEKEPWLPCGMCRQSIYEFFPKDFKIITCNNKGIYKIYSQEEMLPEGYRRNRK